MTTRKNDSKFRVVDGYTGETSKVSQEDAKFLRQHPTRAEMSNYINGVLTDKYIPAIAESMYKVEQSSRLGIMSLQAILVNKGICTGDELQQATQAIIKAAEDDSKEQSQKADTKHGPKSDQDKTESDEQG